jgi:lysosomal-associated transmembrane protein
MGPHRNKDWRCCLGLHVRTATIMIGCWHLILNILAICMLTFIMRNPALLHELENGYDDSAINDMDPPELPTPLSKIEPPYAYRDHSLTYKNYHNIDMGGLVCLCMIAITLMMIYGAVKEKPTHLLPFFCLQLFDFAITTLTAAGYLCYLRSVHRLIAQNNQMPWRDELLKLSPQTLSVVVLVAFTVVVLLKAYAIGIIWRCYKYLTIRQHNLRTLMPYIIPEITNMQQERVYSSLLPDYEEAIKAQPPPSYQVAMATSTPLVVNLNSPTNSATASTAAAADAAVEQNPPAYNVVASTANAAAPNTAAPLPAVDVQRTD